MALRGPRPRWAARPATAAHTAKTDTLTRRPEKVFPSKATPVLQAQKATEKLKKAIATLTNQAQRSLTMALPIRKAQTAEHPRHLTAGTNTNRIIQWVGLMIKRLAEAPQPETMVRQAGMDLAIFIRMAHESRRVAAEKAETRLRQPKKLLDAEKAGKAEMVAEAVEALGAVHRGNGGPIKAIP